MSKPSLVVVLAEDSRHQRFARGYLKRLGYSGPDIRNVELPSGRGSGEQWVRNRYAREVAAYRDRSARAETALIVLVDADTESVARRLQQLERSLADANLPPRAVQERIANVVPKRNVETWILCLNGQDVEEETDYSGQNIDEMISSAALIFFDWTRPNFPVPARCIPSLASSVQEIRRLEVP